MTTTKFVKELYNEDLVYSSVVFGMGFWIDDQGLFLSAPQFKDGSLDIDNAIAVEDWDDFSVYSHNYMAILAQIVRICTLKRDYVRIGYYAERFRTVA